MADNFVLGMDAKAYRGDQLFDRPTVEEADIVWTEITNMQDTTLNLEAGEADVTTRANSGWEAVAAALKSGSVDVTMLWLPGDAGFDAIRNAFLNSTELSMLILDGANDVEGNQGLASNFSVTNFTRNEQLREAMTVTATLKPSSQTEWHTVPAA